MSIVPVRLVSGFLFVLGLFLASSSPIFAQTDATPSASPSPVADGGSLTVFRFVCNVEDAQPKIEVLAENATAADIDFGDQECEEANGLFHLISDGGSTVQSFDVPNSGTVTIDGISPTAPGSDGYRLVDSSSTGNTYIQIQSGQTTTVVSYDFEFVFVMPTPPTIPEINLDDEPPPPPDIQAGAGSGSIDPDDESFQFDPDAMEVPESESESESGFVDQTGATQPIVDNDKTSRQIGFLLLAIGGYVVFRIYKSRTGRDKPIPGKKK